jgi:hypothetical protein
MEGKMYKQLYFMICIILLSAFNVQAHQDGANFSGALIDALKVHHAHIEDEQRLNISFLKGKNGKKDTLLTSLEMAVDWSKEFRWGSEILIPISNKGTDGYGIMDIELWPVKYAFINEPETIFTGVFSTTLPTGDKSKGLGGENTALGLMFFLDHAHKNWFFGLNTEFETVVSGETETEVEIAGVLSYSFISTTGTSMAPSTPLQKIVPAIFFETISESILAGSEKGENIVTVIPGISFWFPSSGWAFRVGAEIPISKNQHQEYSLLFSMGNHLSWGNIF